MQINKKMDIHLIMGNQQNLQFLLDLDTTITSNPQKIQHYLSQSQINEQVGNDACLIIHFDIQQGKQQQALEYIKYALQAGIQQKQTLSPLQLLLKDPKSQGKVSYQHKNGKIILKYRFLDQTAYMLQDTQQFQEQFQQFQLFSVDSKLTLKGQMKHNKQNRTNVKVDYVDFDLSSDQINPSDFTKISQIIGMGIEQLNYLTQVPTFNMISNLKRANFQIKLASFRQIRSYFNKASGEKYNKNNDKPFPYVNKGIFRKQTNCYFFYKNKLSFKAEATYNGQDVFMRLIKIYISVGKSLLC